RFRCNSKWISKSWRSNANLLASDAPRTKRGQSLTEIAGEIKQTPLYDRHVALGARLVPYAGWTMPVQYKGIIHEHTVVREKAGLFDLGHMGQVEVTGPGALALLQYLSTNDVSKIEPGHAQYGLMTNENGGVVDDIII